MMFLKKLQYLPLIIIYVFQCGIMIGNGQMIIKDLYRSIKIYLRGLN